MNNEQQSLLADLQQSFNSVVSATSLKPRDIATKLLAGNVKRVDVIDPATCKVEPNGSEFVRVTFSTPVPDADGLRTYRYRNPNNIAVVDENGNWTGVVTYFREWEGFIDAAVKHLNGLRVHASNL